MSILTLIIILYVCAYLWTWRTTYTHRKQRDMLEISLLGVAAVTNLYYVYCMMHGDISTAEHLLQMMACSCLLPLQYRFFAVRLGLYNRNSGILLWVLAAITLVPNILLYNPLEPLIIPESGLHPYAFYILSHGEKLFAIYTGDLVVMLQSLVIGWRILTAYQRLRSHGLQTNRTVNAFVAFWVVIIVFAICISMMDYSFLRSDFGWAYVILNVLLIISYNILVILHYDIALVETDEGEAVEDVEKYVQTQYGKLKDQMLAVIEEQQQYLDPQMNTEKIIMLLHTNRTYFAEMMSCEMKTTFTDYLSNLRLSHVERLLQDESLSVAEIATQSGFADARYMSRKFKARYGVTPSEWRKAHADNS